MYGVIHKGIELRMMKDDTIFCCDTLWVCDKHGNRYGGPFIYPEQYWIARDKFDIVFEMLLKLNGKEE